MLISPENTERFLDVHIRASIDPLLLSSSQHIYTRGKSVETALHLIISRVINALHIKEYTLAILLNIGGTFDNGNSDTIVSALNPLYLTLVRFTELLLKSRIITSTISENCLQRQCSYLLWNHAVKSL